MKQKLNREDYQFRKKIGQELIKLPGQLNGLDFVISNCEDCVIYICDHAAQIFVDLSKNCKIYIGPVEGSLFIRKCENIEISVASHQFRVSNSNNIKCFILTPGDPALEKSTNITFAPYNFTYPGITQHFEKAKLDLNNNKWSEIYDFTPETSTQNWTLLDPSQYFQITKQIEGLDEPETNPVPIPTIYGGTCTKKILLGSADQRNNEMSLDFLMSKDNVQQKAEEDQPYVVVPGLKYKKKIPKNELLNDEQIEELSQPQQQQQGQINYQILLDTNISVNNQKEQSNFNQKNEEERKLKEEKRMKAKQYLQKFNSDFQELVQQRKVENRQKKSENKDTQQGWGKVIKNIDIKDNGGEKDVTRMSQAIQKKVEDESKK